MGLPVPPGPGSWSSAVLNHSVMFVRAWLKLMNSVSRLDVLGHKKSPEKCVELITTEVVASEARVWTENAGFDGRSVGELKFAVTPVTV